ncbi:DUF397 domain-containing protein [Streptomyces montanisoli]|uniref:DUF397 domain-containing protein n=1 Tax=Streptomyces montanisoli TaxID=2798581 RepID=A0A940RV31_9ACTN|nr:DUF397 domain-containing protein [Streptomyces montanisoli]MBP0458617.1 DUF397 domain-containing protein [Streptomyces montanisoli]
MKSEQADGLRWFKSTHSGGDGGECIEIAAEDTVVHIRDSKERTGPQLAFARDAWTGFVAGIAQNLPS